jgi:3-dehydroquinate synthetase
MSYTISIPIEVVNATHRGGYWELYLRYKQEGMTSRDAFEMVEEQLSRYGLPARFNSYYTFRKSLWRMRKDLKADQRRKATELPCIHL